MYISDAEQDEEFDIRFFQEPEKYQEYFYDIMNSDLSILRTYISICKSNNIKINIKARANNNFYSKCIFHNAEDLPLRIVESKKAFACYGCGQSGTIVSLISSVYGITKKEAIELLHGYIIGDTEGFNKRELNILKEIFMHYNSKTADELFADSQRKTEFLNDRIIRYIENNNCSNKDEEKIADRLCCSKKYVKQFTRNNNNTTYNNGSGIYGFR